MGGHCAAQGCVNSPSCTMVSHAEFQIQQPTHDGPHLVWCIHETRQSHCLRRQRYAIGFIGPAAVYVLIIKQTRIESQAGGKGVKALNSLE